MHKTPLDAIHRRLGAKMVEFAGWEVPLLFAGIVEEHHHTRRAASVFDVSHMGRIEVRGQDGLALLDRVCTRRLGDAAVGQSCYSHICNEQGGVLDDVIVSRYQDHWLVVCNASNRERIVAWLARYAAGASVELKDVTTDTAMVAIQGPRAVEIIASMMPVPIAELKRYRFLTGQYFGVPYSIFRSGYTGEDGVEVVVPAGSAAMVCEYLLSSQDDGGPVKPAGLGARDTLRLEAGMPLYGHELHEGVDSLTAGLGWCVDLSKDFIGADALRIKAESGPARRLVGLEVAGRRIARQGSTLHAEGRPVGEVTSGTMSPTLGKSVAMAFVEARFAEPGTAIEIDLRGKRGEAHVVPLPFYSREKP